MWQMNTHTPMDSGMSYPRNSLPGSVAANMVNTNTNVRRSSSPKAWLALRSLLIVVAPSAPRILPGVRPYRSAAPKIADRKRQFSYLRYFQNHLSGKQTTWFEKHCNRHGWMFGCVGNVSAFAQPLADWQFLSVKLSISNWVENVNWPP